MTLEPHAPSSGKQRRHRGNGNEGPDGRSAVWALVVSAIVSVTVLAGSVGLLTLLAAQSDSGPEAALSLVFVAATVVLVLVVSALTIVFRRLELSDDRQAMGLPAGSIRAVIALLLIMLFFIAAVFLFNRTQNRADTSEVRVLTGISVERFNALETSEMKSATPRTIDGETRYDVELYPPASNTPISDDLAKQLVTTVGTLVTAVAAFYFGANSVASGRGARRPDKDDGGEAGSETPPEGMPPRAEEPRLKEGQETGAARGGRASRLRFRVRRRHA